MNQMMRYRTLGDTGMRLSIISLGGSGYGKVYGDYDETVMQRGFRYALDRGINYIDTAPWYGQGVSESFLGRALQGVPRDRYFIGTKVGRYELDPTKMFNHTAEKAVQSIEESLQRLKLDYVDLLQVHDVEFALSIDQVIDETLPALQILKDKGLCRFIGITGYPIGPLMEVVKRSKVKIDSVLSYARLSLHDHSLKEHFGFFKAHSLPLINACAVSMGLLTETGPQSWNPAPPEIKQACAGAVSYAKQQGVDIARLAHNFSTSFEEAVTTLVSMNDNDMVDMNIDAVLTPLTEKEREVMDHMEKNFFRPLKQRHWEGVEPAQYWKVMREQGLAS